MRQLITFLATGAYVGRISVAPGTFGSALAIPLLLTLPRLKLSTPVLITLLVAFVALAMVVCHQAGVLFADADSGQIVLDEICGMLVAGCLIAPTPAALLLIFVLFRLFDIAKPFPARLIDRRMKNGFGAVADDLVAGLYANLVVRVIT